MDSEKDALLSMGESAPSSPNVPVVQSLHFSKVQIVDQQTRKKKIYPYLQYNYLLDMKGIFWELHIFWHDRAFYAYL